jgi:type IV pilus assembly protein PilB
VPRSRVGFQPYATPRLVRRASSVEPTATRGEISRPDGSMAYDERTVAKRIGELLVEGGVLSQSQLEQALFAQRKDGRKLGQLLIELGLVSEVQLTQTLSRQLSVPWVSLYHVDFSRSLLNLVPQAIAEKYCVVPIFVRRVRKLGETLYVAMDDPTNDAAIEDVTRASTLPVKPMIACPSDIRAAIRVYYLGETAAPAAAPGVAGLPGVPGIAGVAGQPAIAVVPPPAPSSASQVGARPPPPPPPDRSRIRPEPPQAVAAPPPSAPAIDAEPPPSSEAPSEAPHITKMDEKEVVVPRRGRPRMISLTLLDGTTINIPGPPKKKQRSRPQIDPSPSDDAPESTDGMSDQLTARDLVSAMRAVAHGADASDILGTQPRWEAMFSALLSILLRKGVIADWEFVEEFRKI